MSSASTTMHSRVTAIRSPTRTTAARKARAFGIGVNWYLNQNVKASLNYDRTRFDGGAILGGDRPDEQAIFTRLGLAF